MYSGRPINIVQSERFIYIYIYLASRPVVLSIGIRRVRQSIKTRKTLSEMFAWRGACARHSKKRGTCISAKSVRLKKHVSRRYHARSAEYDGDVKTRNELEIVIGSARVVIVVESISSRRFYTVGAVRAYLYTRESIFTRAVTGSGKVTSAA